MTIDGRLIRLEARLKPIGCATCRPWIGAVLCDESGACTRPERCPECGRIVPYQQIIELHAVSLEAI
jgi:hypothetical protein